VQHVSEPNISLRFHRRGNALLAQGDLRGARRAFEQAIIAKRTFAPAYNGLGVALHRERDLDRSIEAFRAALRIDSGYGEAADNLGVVLRERDLDEAKQWFLRSIELEPRNGRFLRHLADHEPVGAHSPLINQLETAATNVEELSLDLRIEALFGYAKVLNDVGRVKEAFSILKDANRLRREMIVYDEASTLRYLRTLARTFGRAFVDATRGCGDPSSRPIFITGMPRSGTTLLEALIAAHPDVRAGDELSTFERGISSMPPLENGTTAGELRNALRSLGTSYVRDTDALAGNAKHLTDKMPFNFRFIPIMYAALPNARIIHVRRNPSDVAYSCFAAHFFDDVLFTYDLSELGRYYRAYEELMAAWGDAVPSSTILEVEYEEIVGDVEAQMRRVLGFCGLDWHDDVLRFHESRRPVRTASQTQVRRPLYATSVGRANALRSELEPFERARNGF
jgi:tetratricopeptide (TPR) repeat protein